MKKKKRWKGSSSGGTTEWADSIGCSGKIDLCEKIWEEEKEIILWKTQRNHRKKKKGGNAALAGRYEGNDQ